MLAVMVLEKKKNDMDYFQLNVNKEKYYLDG